MFKLNVISRDGIVLFPPPCCSRLSGLLFCRGLSQAYGLAVDARGGFSGGTIASGFNQAESESSADVAALMADKYFLLPQDAT